MCVSVCPGQNMTIDIHDLCSLKLDGRHDSVVQRSHDLRVGKITAKIAERELFTHRITASYIIKTKKPTS